MVHRDYRAEPYPLAPEYEQRIQREQRAEAQRQRARQLRDLAGVAQAALAGAHGPTAKALAEEGLTPEHRAHVLALFRWAEAYARELEPDEKRAIKAALDAWNFEGPLRAVVTEIRKEMALHYQREKRR